MRLVGCCKVASVCAARPDPTRPKKPKKKNCSAPVGAWFCLLRWGADQQVTKEHNTTTGRGGKVQVKVGRKWDTRTAPGLHQNRALHARLMCESGACMGLPQPMTNYRLVDVSSAWGGVGLNRVQSGTSLSVCVGRGATAKAHQDAAAVAPVRGRNGATGL